MAASFINQRHKVEKVPHLQMLLHENQATSGASRIYNDKSHWYFISGINCFNEQTPISAFTGNPSGKMYCIHGEVGKLVAQQLQKPNNIRVGINGHRSTEPIDFDLRGDREGFNNKQSSKCQDFIPVMETENIDLETTFTPLSTEDQINKSNKKFISSPPREISPEVENESCPFDLHSWNQKIEKIKDLGGLHSFSSVNTQSSSKSHDILKSVDKPLKLPVKSMRKSTKSQHQCIYLLADDGTIKPLETKQHVKSITTQTCEMEDQLSKMQNNVASDRALPEVHKNVTSTLNAAPCVVLPNRPLNTSSPLHRTVKESINCKALAGEQNLKNKDISVTYRSKITMSNKILFHLAVKALQRSEEKNTNDQKVLHLD
ncbi:uncharacterized protein [Narcine bancroftii]|uniref:uncharacterized protein isoform X2 n=1 Tax=Narcine bancroftii TaxID=1343680 RepID=UPI0038318074